MMGQAFVVTNTHCQIDREKLIDICEVALDRLDDLIFKEKQRKDELRRKNQSTIFSYVGEYHSEKDYILSLYLFAKISSGDTINLSFYDFSKLRDAIENDKQLESIL
jgi:hypothetical protein